MTTRRQSRTGCDSSPQAGAGTAVANLVELCIGDRTEERAHLRPSLGVHRDRFVVRRAGAEVDAQLGGAGGGVLGEGQSGTVERPVLPAHHPAHPHVDGEDEVPERLHE